MLNVMKGLSNLTGLYPRILFIFVWCYSSVTHGQVREQWDTDSGSQVIFIQSSGLPMVDVSVDFFAGAAFDPADKQGLARLTMQLLDKGTQQYDEFAIAERLATTGSQMGGNFDLDRSGVSLRSLSYDEPLTDSISLLAEILSNPVFPAEILDREKEATIVSLRERNTRPSAIAAKLMSKSLFGEHPYRFTGIGTEETIGSLTRSDLAGFHQRFYRASNAVITIVGDLNEDRAKEIAESISDGLPKGAKQREQLISVKAKTKVEELIIPHDSAQAHIRIGMVGFKRGDPDHLPLALANQILGGGGMTSILYDELRERRGMTYGVGSYFNPLRDPGPFVVAFQTRKDQAWDALNVTLNILNDFIENGPDAEQVERAKKYFVGAFALNVDSNGELLDYYSIINFYDLPLNYIDSFSSRVEAVTLQQIRDAISRRMSLDKTVRIIVGPEGSLTEPNG